MANNKFLLILLGGYLIYYQKSKSVDTTHSLAHLKLNGEKLKVEFANCIFKANSYENEITSEFPTRAELYDGLYDSNRNYKMEDKVQTVIIYSHLKDNVVEKFVSQIFYIDEIVLRYRVTNGEVTLYVDKSNRNSYIFDIETS